MPIDIENEVWFFLERQRFDGFCKLNMRTFRDRMSKFKKDFTSLVRMKLAFYFMSNSWNWHSSLFHIHDETFRIHPLTY